MLLTWAFSPSVRAPRSVVLGPGAADWVGAAHLLIGYAGLGLVLARRPHLTGA
jgi:hypothetical protein